MLKFLPASPRDAHQAPRTGRQQVEQLRTHNYEGPLATLRNDRGNRCPPDEYACSNWPDPVIQALEITKISQLSGAPSSCDHGDPHSHAEM